MNYENENDINKAESAGSADVTDRGVPPDANKVKPAQADDGSFDALEAALDDLDSLDFDLEDLEDKIAPLAL